ncbi:hypothetical protein OIDMADRAFT_119069 [Oidiodendron maius Zn]|uniref:NAD(P)-binding protein n=1 Tax=Oidiodendron maius (strain Zn) TaxID=913774 RepID=A0A0C3CWA1_OIDMZ|nr:hypothetical protein OIDMADRAFT_119069 [Oidiodendron maius Zn]
MTWTPESLRNLTGRVYLVTGGNSGNGYQTVLGLAARNAKVYIRARSNEKGTAAVSAVRAENESAKVDFVKMDMMDLKSMEKASVCNKEKYLHGLINNAGIMATPYEESAHKYEAQFQTNYISPWLLTYYLLPLLIETARQSPISHARIVNVSSDGHLIFGPPSGINFNDINQTKSGKGGPWSRYGLSKLANILHAKELNQRYGGTEAGSIWTANLHPGTVDTLSQEASIQATASAFFQTIFPILRFLGVYSKVDTAAYTTLYYTTLYTVASDEFTQKLSSEYLQPVAKVGRLSKVGNDAKLAKDLWEWTTAEIINLSLIPSTKL